MATPVTLNDPDIPLVNPQGLEGDSNDSTGPGQ